jgi:predicted nucleic acid-binding protein
MHYIIDARVILKWFFEERYQPNAWKYLENQNIECMTPDFALFECAGVIRRKIASNKISIEKGSLILHKINSLEGFEIIPSFGFLNRAFEIANIIQHDLYDCIYLALAEQQNSKLVTADSKFFNQVQLHLKFLPFIQWIETDI